MNKIISVILGIVIISSVAFYSGTRYGQNNNTAMVREIGTGGFRGASGLGMNSGMVAGEIVMKDDKSVSVKLRDGGSKFVFFTGAMNVSKTVSGSLDDLKVGEQVMADGTVNQDGSVTAQSIQIRPVK